MTVAEIDIPTRDESIARYELDYQLRVPGAMVGEGTLPTIDAEQLTDMVSPLYADAARLAADRSIATASLEELEARAEALGIPGQLPPSGGAGFVLLVGSGTLLAGDQLTDASGLVFQNVAGGAFTSGQRVPIVGVTTGTQTNLAAGIALQWSITRAGISVNTSVAPLPDGSGLTGGRDQETLAELGDRIREALQHPTASGNENEYVAAVEQIGSLGIQKAFAYPAIQGPGTIALAFTMRPLIPGGSRRPSGAEILIVQNAFPGTGTTAFPRDDTVTVCDLTPLPIDVLLRVRWNPGAIGWLDGSPWPYWATVSNVPVVPRVTNGTSPTATALELTAADTTGLYVAPSVGQTIAFYNTATQSFARKKILSVGTVVGAGPTRVIFTLAFDTSFGASDPNFVPAVGDFAFPWSDSLIALVSPVATYFDGLGPGEQAVIFDAGQRQARVPSSPGTYSSEITSRITLPLLNLSIIDDVQVGSLFGGISYANIPLQTPVGIPSVSSDIFFMRTVGAYAH